MYAFGQGTTLNLLVYTVTIMMFIVNNVRTHTYTAIRLPCSHSAKDFKNRELFEKMFPELKARREQQERFTRYILEQVIHNVM